MAEAGSRNNFAHLHPIRLDSVTYEVALPASMEAGQYDFFLDIVHQSGLSETLYETVEVVPAAEPAPAAEAIPVALETLERDEDDSHYAFMAYEENQQELMGDIAIVLDRDQDKPFVANQIESLRFKAVTTENGLPLPLEPYLSMIGHAAVVNEDASVFIHLHPVGTISMAAQEAFATRINDEYLTLCASVDSLSTEAKALIAADPFSATNMKEEIQKQMEASGLTNEVSFPYAFPKAGKYRMWVQVRIKGEVRTAGFDIEVV